MSATAASGTKPQPEPTLPILPPPYMPPSAGEAAAASAATVQTAVQGKFAPFFRGSVHMMHHHKISSEWREENLPPFDELILSWNGARPLEGRYLFHIRVKMDDWSPSLLYASWGSDGQSSYSSQAETAPVRTYQDAVEVLEGKKATGFEVKVTPDGSAPLDQIHALHVYTNGSKREEPEQPFSYTDRCHLPVNGLSQMALSHERHKDLCSPTSTAALVRYFSAAKLDPVHFARSVWDSGFDIFGNWVLNVAEASAQLGPSWHCWVERLSGFDDLYQRLHQGTPVITSVRGPLPGSAQPYAKGHLMAVIGYDPAQDRVICMDPAFPTDKETHVWYHRSDFIQAWNRRGRVAYVFERKTVNAKC